MSTRPTQDEVGYLVKQLQREVRAQLDRALSAHGVTMATYAAMAVLSDVDGLSNAELARRCFVTPQTMHRIVGDLEAEGLVERHPDPNHGRIRRTSLTDDGTARVAACRGDVHAVEARMLADLSTSETHTFRNLLTRSLMALRGN